MWRASIHCPASCRSLVKLPYILHREQWWNFQARDTRQSSPLELRTNMVGLVANRATNLLCRHVEACAHRWFACRDEIVALHLARARVPGVDCAR